MTADPANPDEPAGAAETAPDGTATPRRWPVVLCACVCSYFLVSAVTLPFVNRLWFDSASNLKLFSAVYF